MDASFSVPTVARQPLLARVDGDERYDYLRSYLDRPEEIELIRNIDKNANTLVLLFPDSLPDEDTELKSTTRLTYCGSFDFHWQ